MCVYPEHSTIERNPKWIQCSAAEIYPSEYAEHWMPHAVDMQAVAHRHAV